MSKESTTLKNALLLLSKVIVSGDTKYSPEDWQMLQVANFLVSKEKFIRRDLDNRTLHYGENNAFYYIQELSDNLYELAKYIYDHDDTMIIDGTKVVQYDIELDPKFKNLRNPTFSEAVIIINMLRNAIAHGKYEIDTQRSNLIVNNSMNQMNDSDALNFNINSTIPISMLSKIDVGKILKKNANVLTDMLYLALLERKFLIDVDKVLVEVVYEGKPFTLELSYAQFFDIYSRFREELNGSIQVPMQESGTSRIPYTFVKDTNKKRFHLNVTKSFSIITSSNLRKLQMLLNVINTNPNKALNPTVVKQFYELMDCSSIPIDYRNQALELYHQTLRNLDFQKSATVSIDSISYSLGIKAEENSTDFVALYNYLIILFSEFPLKEGNKVLTEFIDFSTLSVNLSNTRDVDISNFFSDLEKIINSSYEDYRLKMNQFEYPIPALRELITLIDKILMKFKNRNNAYIRHIRNSVEHSDMVIKNQNVRIRDYVSNGDNVDKTFTANISLNQLVRFSIIYSCLYDIENYKSFQDFHNTEDFQNVLTFTFRDLMLGVKSSTSPESYYKLQEMFEDLFFRAIGRDIKPEDEVVDVLNELINSLNEEVNRRKKNK